eukprot:gene10809-2890_t
MMITWGLRSSTVLLLAVLTASLVHAWTFSDEVNLYVDPIRGNDSNPGTSPASPFKTVQRARDKAAVLVKSTEGGITVHLASGTYNMTVEPFLLNTSHSGTPDCPIRYQALPASQPLFSAGVAIPYDVIQQSSIRKNVLQVNLTKLGVTEYGRILCNTGLGRCPSSSAGNASRLESSGYWQWENIAKVVDDERIFTYDGERPTSWSDEIDHLWLWGYWAYDWADSVVKVERIITKNNTFIVSDATPPTYQFKKSARWFAFNLLSELDVPGEYYVDDTSGMLYFIPQHQLNPDSKVVVTVGGDVVSIDSVSNIEFQGIHFGFGRGNGVYAKSIANVSFVNCIASCLGGSGMYINGKNSSVQNTTVAFVGCKGVIMSGGSPTMLIPSNMKLFDSSIHHFARHTRTYNPGISWSGVGLSFSGNSIHDAPHAAILGTGNDCMFESNKVVHVGFEVDDSGAFYSGRNWNDRGNVIRFNHFESIRTRVPIFLGSPSVQAIYFDDQLSGYEVYNNTFYDCQVGVFIGGGRSHHVKFNTFEKCDTAVHVDTRGLSWQSQYCLPGGIFQQELEGFNYQNPPYAQRYPVLPNIMNELPCYPVYNQVTDNEACDCQQFIDYNITTLTKWRNVIMDNETRNKSGCVQHTHQPQVNTGSITHWQGINSRKDSELLESTNWWMRLSP